MNTLIAQIRNVVPKGVKIVATVIFSIGVICMAIFAFMAGVSDAHATRGFPPAPLMSAGALFFGTFIAAWLLTMGYIYADAKRRGMPPVLWVAIAILIPNMIGIILYFFMREPVLEPCPKCHALVRSSFAFCPNCSAQLRTACPNCRRPVEPGWNNCAFCGSGLNVTPAAPVG